MEMHGMHVGQTALSLPNLHSTISGLVCKADETPIISRNHLAHGCVTFGADGDTVTSAIHLTAAIVCRMAVSGSMATKVYPEKCSSA